MKRTPTQQSLLNLILDHGGVLRIAGIDWQQHRTIRALRKHGVGHALCGDTFLWVNEQPESWELEALPRIVNSKTNRHPHDRMVWSEGSASSIYGKR